MRIVKPVTALIAAVTVVALAAVFVGPGISAKAGTGAAATLPEATAMKQSSEMGTTHGSCSMAASAGADHMESMASGRGDKMAGHCPGMAGGMRGGMAIHSVMTGSEDCPAEYHSELTDAESSQHAEYH